MRRLLASLPFALLVLTPACAHDPLDDESGEQELNHPQGGDDKPKSHRKERQTQEMAMEEQEHEALQSTHDLERDDFLRDRAETKDVKDGIRRRNELAGTGNARPHHMEAPQPKHHEEESKPSGASSHSASSHDDGSGPQRGDVDPTESN